MTPISDQPRRRKTISARMRFKIFERDGFACVYCGARPPGAILVIDHIKPFAMGGECRESNFATACQTCNAGKSDRFVDWSPPPALDQDPEWQHREIVSVLAGKKVRKSPFSSAARRAIADLGFTSAISLARSAKLAFPKGKTKAGLTFMAHIDRMRDEQ